MLKWLPAITCAVALIATGCSEPEPIEVVPALHEDRYRAPAAFDSYRYTLHLEASTDLMDLSEAPPGFRGGWHGARHRDRGRSRQPGS